VAEFVGTMNRVDARISDPASGTVEIDGTDVAVDAARGRERGDHVLLLVRPETIEVTADAGGEGIEGEVLSQTFLGSLTRLHVAALGVEWTADLSAERASGLPVGARVRLQFPSASARLLTLDGAGEAARSLAADPDDH
jgi:putative spermidine/putrescine transport system ATP-binding protein